MEQRNHCKSKNYEMFKEVLGKTRFLKSKHTRLNNCKLDSNVIIFFLNIARHKSLIIGPEHCILIITSKKKIQILENVKNLTE